MYDDFENEIEKGLNEEIVIPDSILKKKNMAFNKIRAKKDKKFRFSYKQKIIASVVAVSIIGGISFGNTTLAAIGNNTITSIRDSLFPENKGVQQAADNGYIQDLDQTIMKDNGVEIKVNNVLKDSKRVALTLTLKFDDKSLLENFQHIKIKLDLKSADGEILPVVSSNYSSTVNKETGELVFNDIMDFWSSSDNDHVKQSEDYLKNLTGFNLEISTIKLFANSSAKFDPETLPKLGDETKKQLADAGVQLYKIIDGTWKTEIKLDDKFIGVEPIKYRASNKDDIINIINAQLLPTGMDIKFNFINYKNEEPLTEENRRKIKEVYLVDDKGIIYKTSNEFFQPFDTELEKYKDSMTFGISSFDEINTLKLMFKDSSGNSHEIGLVK